MKKLTFIIIALLSICIVNNTQAQVSDTAKYLIDSIEMKKNAFVGQPLSTLLNKLKITPKTFMAIIPLRKVDTINFNYTSLDFIDSDRRFIYAKNGIKTPHIDIDFQSTLKLPKSWFMPNGKFFERKWDRNARNLFKNLIIKKIDVRGI